MVELSEERINAKSPYKVTKIRDGNSVTFTTDFGIKYIVGFDYMDLLTSAETYQLYISNVEHKSSPRDRKLRTTIMSIVMDFFWSNDTAMLYVCETGDGKQSMRARLFNYWASEYPQYSQFAVLSETVEDEEGNKNFVSLVIRENHPKAEEVIAEFMTTIKMLRNKPTP